MAEAKFCKGKIQYPCEDGSGICTASIEFPCGARFDTTGPSGEIQLPYRYQILSERAKVGKCCYWHDRPYQFKPVQIDPATLPDVEVEKENGQKINTKLLDEYVVGGWEHENQPSFYIVPWDLNTVGTVNTACVKAEALDFNQGIVGDFPCNGAKTKCPFYTGPKFKFINDEDLEPGKPIIGQMVQEIRSLMIDWEDYNNPQTVWENSFEVPYIWGRDFDKTDDILNIQRGLKDAEFDEESAFIILTRIYWEVENSLVILEEFPSTPVGTETDEESPETPPDFPTIINDLGTALSRLISINFPPRQFTHYQFNGISKIYIAGLADFNSTVYIINTALVDFFDLINLPTIPDMVITEAIENLVYKYNSGALHEGFLVLHPNESSFWEYQSGIHLKENTVNRLFALILSSTGKWVYDYADIDYKFASVAVIQTSFESILGKPQSSPLITKISSINLEAPIEFTTIPIGNSNLTISKVYHFFIHDRSISRFVQGLEEKDLPNQRSWSITKSTLSCYGTSRRKKADDKEKLVWTKLDNCNKYLIEITDPGLSRVIPAGLDRAWEPTSILFCIEEDICLEMEIVPDFGRNLNGFILPINCIIVEPKEDIDLGGYNRDSIMYVTLDNYSVNGATDDTNSLLDHAENKKYFAGGVQVPVLSENDVYRNFSHSISIIGNSIKASHGTKFDMSYMLEFSIEGTPVGRKWIYGVAELGESWARDVDVSYSWGARQFFKRLIPDYYYAISATSREQDYERSHFNDDSGWLTDYSRAKNTVYRPNCGDHDNAAGKGPLFFPYEKCSDPYYNIETFGFSYYFRISYASALDEKYRGPDAAYPFIYHINALAILDCIFDFSWATLYRIGVLWMGFSRLRGPVSPFFNTWRYLLSKGLGWELPQFGNSGREHIRINRTMHYRQFLYLQSGYPKVGEGWMPTIPFIGTGSIFDTGFTADNLIERSVDIGHTFEIDPYNYDSGEFLLSLSTSGINLNEYNDADNEKVLLERKSFDDVYKVRKVRSPSGLGSFWPPQGFYFNFKNDKTFWTFPEKELSFIFRKYNSLIGDPLLEDKFLSGITISKPTLDTINFSFTEKYNRPIYVSFPEGKYNLKLFDQVYEDGELKEYASITITKEEQEIAYLYFDRFSGEIKTTNIDTSQLYYDADTSNDLLNSLGDLSTEAYYTTEPLPSGYPISLSGINDYIKIGNLAVNSKVKIFSTGNVLGDPLEDNSEENWVGFLPALNIDSILPKFLPQIETTIDLVSTAIPETKFTVYPGDIPMDRYGYSNININLDRVLGDGLESFIFWKPLSIEEDLIEAFPSGFDPKVGCISASTLIIKFKHPIMISKLDVGYSIYGQETDSYSSPTFTNKVDVGEDPSFKIILDSFYTSDVVLVDKPTLQLKPGTSTLDRDFYFISNLADVDPANPSLYSYFDGPVATSEIRIAIGQREKRVGYILRHLNIFCRLLREISEEIIVTDPKYYPSTGYIRDVDKLRLPPQNTSYLTSITSSIDLGDPYEATGIAEYWRPGNLDEANVGTIGKLRRHWANKFYTFDTLKYYSNVNPEASVLLSKSASESENQQGAILNTFTTEANSVMNNKLFLMQHGYYISPYDKYRLSKLSSAIPLDISSSKFKITTPWINSYKASIGSQKEGWQDPGYQACISKFAKTQKRRCGLGPSIALDPDAQSFCRGGTEVPAFRTFDIGALRFSKFLKSGEALSYLLNDVFTGVSAAYKTYNQQYLKNLNRRYNI